ncbi:MAG: TRAP transporter substrate-binding protein DctP [Pseudomonadota bacterium]|nr:TRAP transporter substrate-binding protein DctP [Pseudomonadota bacterium]
MVLTSTARKLFCALVSIAPLLAASSTQAAQTYTLKFATLTPQGTEPMNIMEEWGRTVKEQSNGKLVFKFYPGGIQGDEPEVLKKMRFGQIQGGGFTGYGVGRIYSPARILEFPFLFRNNKEVDEVRAKYMPDFETGFRKRGYELLGWSEVGYIHFFSREPIRSLDDLGKRRIWLWQGDPLSKAWFDAADLSPISLSITDVYTSLSTGMIDTVYATPLVAMALQWYTKTGYMTNVPMANGIGALVVSRRFFDRLPPDLQQLLRETGRETGEKLTAVTREDNRKSLALLEREGLDFVLKPDDVDQGEVRELSEQAATRLARKNYIPKPLFDETRELLQEIRKRSPSGQPGG